MLEKPKRPYKNREDARQRSTIVHKEKLVDPNFYPCRFCDGSGQTYDEKQYDQYEGYKLAGKLVCQSCGGTGNIGRERFTEWYRRIMDLWKKDLETFNDIAQRANKTISKLSKEELYYLKKWWQVND